jgi:hypothetical protein
MSATPPTPDVTIGHDLRGVAGVVAHAGQRTAHAKIKSRVGGLTVFLKVVWGAFASKSSCGGEAHLRSGRVASAAPVLASTLLTAFVACGPSQLATVAPRKGRVAPAGPLGAAQRGRFEPAAPSQCLSARPKCCCVVRCGSAGNTMISPETTSAIHRRGSVIFVSVAYSITSSARASSVGGTSRPSAFAVVRLITKSNFVGCSTGMSLGFAPRRILST